MTGKNRFTAFCFLGVCVATLILETLNWLKLTDLSPWLPMAIFVAVLLPVFTVWIVVTIFASTRMSQYK